jgi:hypothetical protein
MIPQNVARLGLVLTLAAAVACQGDGATAPTATAVPPVRLEVVNPAVTATVLTRTTPLDADYTVSKVVGPLGGTLKVPGGLTITVPPMALRRVVILSATALKGNIVAYEFGPHGTVFNVPLVMTQDLHGTSGEGMTGISNIEVGYFLDRAKLDYVSDRASINEFLPASLSVSLTGESLTYSVKHFSGYVIVTGRNP